MKNFPLRKIFLLFFPLAFFSAPFFLFAAEPNVPSGGYYANLAQICGPQGKCPGVEFLGEGLQGVGDVLGRIYVFGLGIAALSAFLMITIGGVQYIFSAGNAGKMSEGRKRITNALMGLAIAVASWAILYTIDPSLVKGWTAKIVPIEPIKKTASPGNEGTSGLPPDGGTGFPQLPGGGSPLPEGQSKRKECVCPGRGPQCIPEKFCASPCKVVEKICRF